ncbi:MAG: S26 family signal peptidase, partial [Algoriella sp.]
LEEKVASKRRKNLERELDWVRQGAKGRQTKQKARLQNYDKLLNEDQKQLDENLEIYIPNGPRLGTNVIEAKNVAKAFGDKLLYDNFGIISTDYNAGKKEDGTFIYQFAALTDTHVTAMKSNANVVSVEPILQPVGEKTEHIVNGKIDSTNTIFPVNKDWNTDQYGPLYIPKKGDIVDVNKETLAQYINIIRRYEHNSLRVDSANGKFDVFINDQKTNKYEIKQNYYFMMGDNRNQSLDARFFGYVGEDHVIGRPIMIWANMNGMFEKAAPKKFIWNRFFTSINNDNPDKTSYGIYVLIALIGWIGYDIVKARKEKKKNKY